MNPDDIPHNRQITGPVTMYPIVAPEALATTTLFDYRSITDGFTFDNINIADDWCGLVYATFPEIQAFDIEYADEQESEDW